MTTFEFTKRLATFVKRSIEAYGEDFKADFEVKSKMTPKEFNDVLRDNRRRFDGCGDYDYCYTVKCLSFIKVYFTIDYEECNEDSDDEDSDEERLCLPNMDSFKPSIAIFYEDKHNSIDYMIGQYEGFTEYDWVDSLVKLYTLCECNRTLSEINGYCKSCYIRATEQEEDCCCCGENEGIWIKLKCNHFIHRKCWEKIQSFKEKDCYAYRKCPLCRNESTLHDYSWV
jgi:hypothetical protein